MEQFIPLITSAVLSTGSLIIAFAYARRQGLPGVQKSFAEESARLTSTLKSRVDILESENTGLKAELKEAMVEIKRLEGDNERLQRRVTRLEHDLLELMQGRDE